MSGAARRGRQARGRGGAGRALRRAKTRPVKRTVLIVGEGLETEPNYFRELRRESVVSERFTVAVKKGHGRSPEAVAEEAIKYKRQAENRGEYYDEVWCVLDVEGLGSRASLESAIIMAGQNSIKLCLSNPCFEVWLLAHFVRESRSHSGCDSVERRLNPHWRGLCKQDYRKGDERIYARISHLTETAIGNAKLVRETDHRDVANTADANSSTEVYRLVSYLLGSTYGGS